MHTPACRQTVAVVVEGVPVITLLEGAESSLREVQQLAFAPGDARLLPAAVCFDVRGRLWAAARCPFSQNDGSPSVALRVWESDSNGSRSFQVRGQAHAGCCRVAAA